MKYKDLNPIQCANYWALMNIVDLFYEEFGENHKETRSFHHSLNILETNLKLELFTDEEENNDT